jgi:hypothetical protein
MPLPSDTQSLLQLAPPPSTCAMLTLSARMSSLPPTSTSRPDTEFSSSTLVSLLGCGVLYDEVSFSVGAGPLYLMPSGTFAFPSRRSAWSVLALLALVLVAEPAHD